MKKIQAVKIKLPLHIVIPSTLVSFYREMTIIQRQPLHTQALDVSFNTHTVTYCTHSSTPCFLFT